MSEMTHEEWCNTNRFKSLRLLNNLCADAGQLAGRISDVLAVIDSQYDLGGCDKRCIVDRQLRIFQLEAENLFAATHSFSGLLERLGKSEKNA